jgi:glycosyltransferase involved in cell wall biosynthesis
MTMRILLVPSNDWMTHPNPMRHHFLFGRLAEDFECEVFVLSYNGLGRSTAIVNRELVSCSRIRLIGRSSFRIINPALYYAVNAKDISTIIDWALRELGIDIVVNSNLIPGAIAGALARQRNIPMVFDFMEYYPQSASAYFENPLTKNLAEFVAARFMRYLIHISDAIITVSDVHAELVGRLAGGKSVYVVPNGVDFELFGPTHDKVVDRRSLSSELRLLYVGSVDDWLDMETVLRAVQKLKHEPFDVSLNVVGGCHGGAYIENVKSLVCSYGLENNVSFSGFVPYRQIPYYLCAADAVLAPYRNVIKNNVTPLKVLEYLACQKIVLCTKVPELVRRFGNLLFFYEGSEDLARLLRLVYSDGSAMQRKVSDARKVLANYSWDVLAKKYYEILRTVLTNGRTSAGSRRDLYF